MRRFLVACLLSLSCCAAQNHLPAVGRVAPPVQLAQLIDAPAGTPTDSAAFRGRPVVLEFWATWCGGCVAAIPHLNALAKEFQGKPVVFLSVTDENPAVVRAFLKRRPMGGWIGVDRDDATVRRYGIFARPQTFLIDAHGVLRGEMLPNKVDAGLIDRLIAGRLRAVYSPIADSSRVETRTVAGAPAPLLDVRIRPAAPVAVSGYSPGAQIEDHGSFQIFGGTLRSLLAYADGMRSDRIQGPAWIDQDRFDLAVTVPYGRDAIRKQVVAEALTETFGLSVRHEEQPTEVYVLRAASGGATGLKPSHPISKGFWAAPGHLTGVGTSIPQLIFRLGGELHGVQVVDETGLQGSYNFDLIWQAGDVASLKSALHRQLGLSLTKESGPEDFLVLVAAEQAKTR